MTEIEVVGPSHENNEFLHNMKMMTPHIWID